MNLKELFRNYGGVVLFYLTLAVGAYLIGMRFNHLDTNINNSNSNYSVNK